MAGGLAGGCATPTASQAPSSVQKDRDARWYAQQFLEYDQSLTELVYEFKEYLEREDGTSELIAEGTRGFGRSGIWFSNAKHIGEPLSRDFGTGHHHIARTATEFRFREEPKLIVHRPLDRRDLHNWKWASPDALIGRTIYDSLQAPRPLPLRMLDADDLKVISADASAVTIAATIDIDGLGNPAYIEVALDPAKDYAPRVIRDFSDFDLKPTTEVRTSRFESVEGHWIPVEGTVDFAARFLHPKEVWEPVERIVSRYGYTDLIDPHNRGWDAIIELRDVLREEIDPADWRMRSFAKRRVHVTAIQNVNDALAHEDLLIHIEYGTGYDERPKLPPGQLMGG